jgi:hypothetical protein
VHDEWTKGSSSEDPIGSLPSIDAHCNFCAYSTNSKYHLNHLHLQAHLGRSLLHELPAGREVWFWEERIPPD